MRYRCPREKGGREAGRVKRKKKGGGGSAGWTAAFVFFPPCNVTTGRLCTTAPAARLS